MLVVVLGVLIIAALLAAAVFIGLMMRRDEDVFGAYGFLATLVAGMIALPYGVLTSV